MTNKNAKFTAGIEILVSYSDLDLSENFITTVEKLRANEHILKYKKLLKIHLWKNLWILN